MLYGFDLNQLFQFPFESQEARKNFFIGSALILSGFIFPILPYLLVIGYVMQIMRQVMRGEKPRMVTWDNWGTLLKDGAKLFFVRLIYSLPLLLIMLPVFLILFIIPVLASVSDRFSELFVVTLVAIPLLFICLIPLSLGFSLVVPVAEAHVVFTGRFSAGFELKDWWAIFRKNQGGFIVAFCIFYGFSIAMSFAFQIIFMTVILICLMPFILPMLSMYLILIQFTTAAQAYRDSRDKIARVNTTAVAQIPA
jgi:hypothetical protein